MKEQYSEQRYPIGFVSKMLNVCQATLRIWERKGLIKPERDGNKRRYNKCDIEQLKYIKELLQNSRINIQGVKKILNTVPCWEIKKCDLQLRNSCPIYINRLPR